MNIIATTAHALIVCLLMTLMAAAGVGVFDAARAGQANEGLIARHSTVADEHRTGLAGCAQTRTWSKA